MIQIKFNEKTIENIINNIENGIVRGLEEFGGVVNADIVNESRKPKTGTVRKVKINGRIVNHISANARAGESSAEMTGEQNRQRYFRSSKDRLTIGVKDSVPYAVKNENKFKDIKQSIDRNQDKLAPMLVNHINILFQEK